MDRTSFQGSYDWEMSLVAREHAGQHCAEMLAAGMLCHEVGVRISFDREGKLKNLDFITSYEAGFHD